MSDMEAQGTGNERNDDARSRCFGRTFCGVVSKNLEDARGETIRVTKDRRCPSAELVRLNAPSEQCSSEALGIAGIGVPFADPRESLTGRCVGDSGDLENERLKTRCRSSDDELEPELANSGLDSNFGNGASLGGTPSRGVVTPESEDEEEDEVWHSYIVEKYMVGNAFGVQRVSNGNDVLRILWGDVYLPTVSTLRDLSEIGSLRR